MAEIVLDLESIFSVANLAIVRLVNMSTLEWRVHVMIASCAFEGCYFHFRIDIRNSATININNIPIPILHPFQFLYLIMMHLMETKRLI